MEVIIKGDPKEIAALALAVQGQQISVDEIMKQITDQIASELSSVHIQGHLAGKGNSLPMK